MVAVVFISVTILDRTYSLVQYFALCVVISGFLVVGSMDIYNSDDKISPHEANVHENASE